MVSLTSTQTHKNSSSAFQVTLVGLNFYSFPLMILNNQRLLCHEKLYWVLYGNVPQTTTTLGLNDQRVSKSLDIYSIINGALVPGCFILLQWRGFCRYHYSRVHVLNKWNCVIYNLIPALLLPCSVPCVFSGLEIFVSP